MWLLSSSLPPVARPCYRRRRPRAGVARPLTPQALLRTDRSPLTDAAAIRLARDSQFGFADLLFESPARVDCVIKGGGPAPGTRVPGSCATSVSRDGTTGAVIVTFTEYWDGRSFHYAGEPEIGELSHSWVFVVGPAGDVTLLANRGNFPPQLVR